MNCPKCNGFMVTEEMMDGGYVAGYGWRCVNCGDVIDQQIIMNRSRKGVNLLKLEL